MCFIDPLPGCKDETVQPGLNSKPIEFDGIKIRIIKTLPNPQKFYSIPVPQPVLDNIIGPVRIFVPGNIRQADIVLIVFVNIR
jgi:hypothetical protein